MIPDSTKITLLLVSLVTLYFTHYLPGIKELWKGLSKRKLDAFLVVLLFISVTFLVGVRSGDGTQLIDTNRIMRVVVIFFIILMSWQRILTTPAKNTILAASIKYMAVYFVAALLTSIYSVDPSLTAYKAIEVFAHVSLAIMLARKTKTLEDGQIIINFIWLILLFLVINTFWGAVLYPSLAFRDYTDFVGVVSMFPRLNPNTASQVGASMGVGALAMIGTRASMARFTALPIAPDELSTCSSAGDSFSRKVTAPSAARTLSERATFLISVIASLMRLMGKSERQPNAPDLKRDRNVQTFDLADNTWLSKFEHFRKKSGPD